jgi:hypothetical protein
MRVSTAFALTLVLASGSLLSGCSIFSPMPLFELTKAGASMVAGSVSESGPSKASETINFSRTPITSLCIEFNPESQAQDFLPALMSELQAHHIQARVYEPGGPRNMCEVWLRYTASIAWAQPPMGDGYQSYLTRATLVLNDQTGRVLGTSSFILDDAFLNRGRWATTQAKIAPAVKALLDGSMG